MAQAADAGFSPLAAGIDRWRKGWVIALAGDRQVRLMSCSNVSEALELTSECHAVAIDIPIALPVSGGRAAEYEVRSFLGPAGRSVFYSPTRQAIQAESRAEASELNQANGGPGISAQSWGLAASIRETRAALAGHARGASWWETHPETAFAIMNGDKAVTSKKSARGVMARIDLLSECFDDVDAALRHAPDGVPIDDILDAMAAAWSAHRILAQQARLFGPDGRDDEGFALGVRI